MSISLASAGLAGAMMMYYIDSVSAGVDVFGTTLVSHNKFVYDVTSQKGITTDFSSS